MRSSFAQMWQETVANCPDHTAVEVATTAERLTYVELHQEASHLAQRIAASGISAGQLIGIRTQNRLQFCVALLGAWLAETVPVPVSATAPDSYVDGLLQRLGAAGCVNDDTEDTPLLPLALLESTVPANSSSVLSDLAYVMHTSGSTGHPKPVGLPNQALAAYCAAFADAAGLGPADRFLQIAPTTFDVVFEELLPIWMVGGTAVLAPQTLVEPQQLLEIIDSRHVTVAEITTVLWRLLVKHLSHSHDAVPRSLRTLIAGGETASLQLINDSLQLGLPLAHVYGVTEAGITSTIKFFHPGTPATAVSVGPPISSSTIHIVDDAGRSCSPGCEGEVWIGGATLASGYLGMPAETSVRFVEPEDHHLPKGRYYRTGDLGRIDDRGELEILGRLDAEIKVNGIRVDLSEIEAALRSAPDVVDAAAIGSADESGAVRILGFVVPSAESDLDDLATSTRRHLTTTLPPHLVPTRILIVGVLPISEHGKVDRKLLARMAADNRDLPSADSLTETQRSVANAWTRALGRVPDSIDQNFADAGGDSLALLTVVVNLRELGFETSVSDCLASPSIRALAAHLDGTVRHLASSMDAERHRQHARLQLLRRRQTRGGSSW